MRKFLNFILFVSVLLCFSGCTKQDWELGKTLTKKVDGDKLSLIVLAKSEYDQKGNIILKKTGSYADLANDSFGEKLNGKRAFRPVLSDCYDIYYQHEYDQNGNLLHTSIHNTKNQHTIEYFFEYDEKGNIVHCKSGKGDDHWYEYDERGNMTHRKSHFENDFSDYNRMLGMDEYTDTYFNHEYGDSRVKTTIESNDGLFLFGDFYFKRYYSVMRQIQKLTVEMANEELLRIPTYIPCVYYRYGKKGNTEYYTNYKSQVYGYGTYFGSKDAPVGVDGKVYFDFFDRSNKAERTFVEYYLRDDGSVEKSIEYTGFRKTTYHKRIYGYVRYGHRRKTYSLFPDHYEYD